MDEEVKRWTAKRKRTLVLEIIQGKTTVSVLQPQAPTPGASDENPCGCFCVSRVT
jgi:hypothetical protein